MSPWYVKALSRPVWAIVGGGSVSFNREVLHEFTDGQMCPGQQVSGRPCFLAA